MPRTLFPNDAPAASKPPDWYQVERDAAEARLTGRHVTGQDDAAGRLFPSEARKAAQTPSAGSDSDDPAKALFGKDATTFDEKPAAEFFEGFAMSATADGDMERAQALREAGEVIANARAAGTDAADLADALNIVRERSGIPSQGRHQRRSLKRIWLPTSRSRPRRVSVTQTFARCNVLWRILSLSLQERSTA